MYNIHKKYISLKEMNTRGPS